MHIMHFHTHIMHFDQISLIPSLQFIRYILTASCFVFFFLKSNESTLCCLSVHGFRTILGAQNAAW